MRQWTTMTKFAANDDNGKRRDNKLLLLFESAPKIPRRYFAQWVL